MEVNEENAPIIAVIFAVAIVIGLVFQTILVGALVMAVLSVWLQNDYIIYNDVYVDYWRKRQLGFDSFGEDCSLKLSVADNYDGSV